MIGPLDGERARRELAEERKRREAFGVDFVPASDLWRHRAAFAVDEAGMYVASEFRVAFRPDRRVTLLEDAAGRIVKGYWARGSSLLERSMLCWRRFTAMRSKVATPRRSSMRPLALASVVPHITRGGR